MKKILSLAAFLIPALLSIPVAYAADAGDFSCPALRDKKSYEGEFEQFEYLLPGKDGWFFRTEQDLRTSFVFRHENEQLISELAKYLKAKGTDLVIAYPLLRGIAAHQYAPVTDPLAKGYNPAMAMHNYKKLIEELNKDGVHMIGNPDSKIGAGYVMKADQHWTPAGASEMAQAIAVHVKTLPSYAALKKTEFTTKELPAVMNEPSFNVVLEGLCKKKAPPEKVVLTETSPTDKAGGAALLEDGAAPEVVLVGTSNSRKELNDPNFAGRLKEFLSVDVYNAAVSGGGVDDALLVYLSSDEYKRNPAKILVWEIPSYYDLDGGVVRSMLRQFQGSVFRSCEKPLAEAKGATLGADTAVLKDISVPASPPYYFGVKFSGPAKDFSVKFAFDNGGTDELKVKPNSRNYPKDGAFYYAPKIPVGASLSSVSLSGSAGANADAQLCAFP